ncbi:DUF1788 domain-containing protein [Listeria booriae]|uniref:DUF1788 domain-containing protein n=1 Tax=Listeria booriae TaxID=1552123 RepID=UPI00162616E2|nr:DUF1788 domain-containing protein [Listeria booriae]MBC2369751.1 DUF1788 domain-containing protein [Listeria booriae]
MLTIADRLDKIPFILADSKFQSKEGLGNELNFHVFDYNPDEELLVQDFILELPERMLRVNTMKQIQIFNLYQIVIHFFERKKYIEKNFLMEERDGSEQLFNRMRSALKVATAQDEIVKYIMENIEEDTIVIITGVGAVFSLVRSHVILNNLQTVVENRPLILFYPGVFCNGTLKLFGVFEDKHYYRAFQLVER